MLEAKALAAGLLTTLRGWLAPTVKAIDGRLLGLDKRIDELERRLDAGPFKYLGPFTEGMEYAKGAFVTHQGSLWHCNYPTRARPGEGYDWTLAVKHGRDLR